MAVVVTHPDVQQWLEQTKLSITAVDVELAESHTSIVFARLADRYDSSGWVTPATTPRLVRVIISMMVASSMYRRQYSDEGDNGSYAWRLESSAWKLLGALAGGSLTLDEPQKETARPIFFPTDAATALAESEGEDYHLAAKRSFSMGMVF